MKYDETTELKIEEVDEKGRGCGRIDRRRACSYFVFPGETIVARLAGRRQGTYRMVTERIVKESPHRVEPRCPQAGSCGGCKWQMIDYEHQLELKKGLLIQALGPAGLIDGDKIEIVPCQEQYHFRNRMDFAVSWKGEIGLKAPGHWNRYVDATDCRLLSEDNPEIMRQFKDWVEKSGIQPWDNRFQRGNLRYLVIREGKNTGQRLVMVLTATPELPDEAGLVERLKPLATTIIHGMNPTVTDLSYASEARLLHGKPELEEEVNGKRFIVPVNSFFQTNTKMAGKLVDTVADFLSDRPIKTLLDLYCGVGFFGISLADRAEKVIGVELDEQAIAVATKNAEANGVHNARFTAAAAESLIWENERPDTVIIDPPRAGLHPKVVRTLLEKRPERLIYVSCNYSALAREWAELKGGYECRRIIALDLFPHTPHLETVALLERK